MSLTLDDVDRLIDKLAEEYAQAESQNDEAAKKRIRSEYDDLETLRLRVMEEDEEKLIEALAERIAVIEGIVARLGDHAAMLGIKGLAKKAGLDLTPAMDTTGNAPASPSDEVPTEPPAPPMDSPDPVPPGPPTAFIAARAAGTKRVVYVDAEGREVVREGGSRAWRTFNPGNIRKGSFAKSAGSIGDDGAFAIFPDHKSGLEAVVTLLRTTSYINLTLVQAVFRYAPPNENNSEQYAKFVEDKTGIDRDTVLSTLKVAEIRKIAGAIQVIEGWIEGSESANMPLAGEADEVPGMVVSAAETASEWMALAQTEAALPRKERSQWPDPGENPRIIKYFKVGASWFDPTAGDEDDWCAAFINYCLVTSGYIGTDHPGARSFFWNKKKQFLKLNGPAFGAIAVRRYAPFSDPKWATGKGHVGFVHSWTESTVTLLGGNQSRTVRLSKFPLVTFDGSGKKSSEFVAFMMPVKN